MTKYDPALPVNQELILQEGMITDPAVIPDRTQVDQMTDGPTVSGPVDLTDLPPGSFTGYTDISEDEGLHDDVLSDRRYTMLGGVDDDD
jgi:hypothetical protein